MSRKLLSFFTRIPELNDEVVPFSFFFQSVFSRPHPIGLIGLFHCRFLRLWKRSFNLADQFFGIKTINSLFTHLIVFFSFHELRYRRENNRLTSDQSRLQATYREIENQSKFLSEKIMRQQVCGALDNFIEGCLCFLMRLGGLVFG